MRQEFYKNSQIVINEWWQGFSVVLLNMMECHLKQHELAIHPWVGYKIDLELEFMIWKKRKTFNHYFFYHKYRKSGLYTSANKQYNHGKDDSEIAKRLKLK